MEILKFRIKNYKSINDSRDCYFSKKFTILAGKNESGKTTTLEALSNFDENALITKDVKPLNDENAEPDVAITFKLTTKELGEILQKLHLKTTENIKELTLHKKIGTSIEDSYYLDDNFAQLLVPSADWHKLQEKLGEHLEEFPEPARPVVYTEKNDKNYRDNLLACRNKTTAQIINGTPKQAPALNEQQISELDKIITLMDYHLGIKTPASAFIEEFVKTMLPYFILHTSKDTFPDSVKIEELGKNPYIADLEIISTFKKELFIGDDQQRIANNQNKVNLDFNEKINKFWTQDSANLEVQKDGNVLYFWVNEEGTLYKPSQRSLGKQWFLSFFVKVCARMAEDKPNIILIDEPGLYLHAQAQKNLLDVLEKHTSDYPVVFSTHSPYLITENNLENVRLVEKNNKQTRIIGKLHDPSISDKETLTPILTAIGLGMNDSITDLSQKDNVVVEGPEDTFYLNALKLLLPEKERPTFNFINGGGSGKMGFVGAILEGWGCNVKYLFDNDQGGKDGEANLLDKKSWAVLKDSIKKVSESKNEAIADIFSKDDFKEYVLENESATYDTSNSQYLKNKRIDKVLKARRFFQVAQSNPSSIKLSTETIEKVKKLFKELGRNE